MMLPGGCGGSRDDFLTFQIVNGDGELEPACVRAEAVLGFQPFQVESDGRNHGTKLYLINDTVMFLHGVSSAVVKTALEARQAELEARCEAERKAYEARRPSLEQVKGALNDLQRGRRRGSDDK